MRTRLLFLLVGLCFWPAGARLAAAAASYNTEPAAQSSGDSGDAAYAALRAGNLDRAVEMFRLAIAARPDAPHLHKDLAYTLLKTGEREEARDQFAEALRIDAKDEQSSLEYGFLCYETKRPIEARRIFLRLKNSGSERTGKTAAAAFENIDRPLREGIERWKAAVAAAPDQWTAHEELARLAEERDELDLAAEHYQAAMRLRPAERRLMIDLARVWNLQGKSREAMALLLAASRSLSPRIAEMARELMPSRYPYPYEFEEALIVDPSNRDLRREYAFLLLAMGKNGEARQQFEIQLKQHPNDRVSAEQLRLLTGPAPAQPGARLTPGPQAGTVAVPPAGTPESALDAASAKEMGLKSYHRGYIKDALRYLQAAWEESPGDPEVALQLGWTLNLLKRDDEALQWFDRARQSDVADVAREADRAFRNLRGLRRATRFTVWTMPMYSSRWDSTFLYSQAKLEFVHLKKWGFQPYVSLRWYGDTRMRETLPGDGPGSGAMLSDSAFMLAAGVNRFITPRLFVWAEAGRAFSYLGNNPASGAGQADYRGGASYLRGWGAVANNGERGLFYEAGGDAVYVSRYNNNLLMYGQYRRGYTLPALNGGLYLQPLWNFNWTADVERQWWGNFAETGPGVRVRWDSLPPNVSLRMDLLRGAYLVNRDNPHRPNYWDVRASLWYAFTH
jgi:Tfp pilus assembly protein PilF